MRASKAISPVFRRSGVVIFAFAKIAFQTQTAYRSAYWMTFVNMLVRMFAVGAVWNVLVRSKPDAIDVDRAAMVSYGMLAVVVAQLVTWWDGPHVYMEDRIRQGTITTDLRWPIYFPVQIFARSLGDGLAKLIGYVIPGYVFGLLVLGLQLPLSLRALVMFLGSLALGYVLIFQFNFLLGLIAVYTLRITGIQHAYHGIVSLLSGVVVPLWFFPPAFRAIVDILPFRGLFGTPVSLYIGQLTGADAWLALSHQGIWVLILWGVIWLAWRYTYRHISIQGG